MKAALLLFSFLMFGCDKPDCGGVWTYVPRNVGKEGAQVLRDAAKLVSEHTGKPTVFVPTEEHMDQCHFAFFEKNGTSTLEGDTAAWNDAYSNSIVVEYHEKANKLRRTVMHELLHGYGLKHIEGDGIMNEFTGGGFEWTEADQEECERVEVCEPIH